MNERLIKNANQYFFEENEETVLNEDKKENLVKNPFGDSVLLSQLKKDYDKIKKSSKKEVFSAQKDKSMSKEDWLKKAEKVLKQNKLEESANKYMDKDVESEGKCGSHDDPEHTCNYYDKKKPLEDEEELEEEIDTFSLTDSVLDGFTFQDLIDVVFANESIRDAEAIEKVFTELLDENINNAKEVFASELERIEGIVQNMEDKEKKISEE